jgi:DNA-binding transcriptional LysR family regulator
VHPPPQLHARRLFDGDFACVLRKDHPLAGRALTARQFVELGHVVTTASHHDLSTVDATLASHGMQRRAAVVVPQYSVVPYVIARSDFIAVLPRALAEAFARLFSLHVIEPPLALPGYTISQVWHERTHRSLAHRWLRETVTGLVAACQWLRQRRRHPSSRLRATEPDGTPAERPAVQSPPSPNDGLPRSGPTSWPTDHLNLTAIPP